jgi:1-acyl-sn-glycerol-3-phosphate acyltransferase
MFVVLLAAAAGPAQRESVWHLVVGLFALPAVFLAPVYGAFANSLPKRWVLVGSAVFCLVVTLAFAPAQGWFWCLGLVALGSALYMPVRYALLPSAARDARLPLTRVNGWIEMGAVAAIVGGMFLADLLSRESPVFAAGWDVPLPVAAAVGLSLLAVVAALPVSFASDVRRPESPLQALAGFFRDGRRILRQGDSRGSLLAWAGFRGLVAAVTGAFIADVMARSASAHHGPFAALLEVLLWILGGAAAGSLLAGVQGHPRRSLGLVPLGLTGLLAALLWAARDPFPGAGLCLLVGLLGGMVNVPLSSAYQESLPADARGNGMAVLNTAGYLFMTAMSALLFGLSRGRVLSAQGQLWFVAALSAIGVAWAWRCLFRDSLEQVLEIVLWPIYRVHAGGPGMANFPRRGPLLVLANHSSWFDPLWLAKVLPRRLTPMMTSLFYDLPVLRFLMMHVVHAIRVQDSSYRREAPELREAIAALDRGEAVVLFPEGMLRRRADQPLRQFGQGAWHILRERPDTPVVCCWIEGGWGSYMSYYGGPPLANKRPDWWRRIDVAVSDPQILDPALLGDDRVTRSHLMRACLAARTDLGLVSVAEAEAPEEEPAAPELTA